MRTVLGLLQLLALSVSRGDDACTGGLCAAGQADTGLKWCCDARCKKCGGSGCGAADNGASAETCCPAKWTRAQNGTGAAICGAPTDHTCKLPPASQACAVMAMGKARQRKPKRGATDGGGNGRRGSGCHCHGKYSRVYRGACLPSFMVIGSQKAATSKLRWYLSRHPAIDVPKEEAFHSGPNAVAAWDTANDPKMLTSYLEAFEDTCNSTERISGLKMPDYIVMSQKTIQLFHAANPVMRVVVTIREPVARMYSYFSMQLRFGWSPINHMGKNPCMQRRLRELLRRKEAAAASSSKTVVNATKFTSEEIMVTNLECVRPCYANNATGVGLAAEKEIWHDEQIAECRNIYFTPLVHSMYALHLRRWLQTFERDSLLLLRFDDLVLRPIDALQKIADFLALPRFPRGFKVEVGRENYTTIARLLKTGAVTPASLRALESFFAPHDAQLSKMFNGAVFW
jgi:[heparan sulfate]-glucosamine 3-sulfotransferase 5